LESAYAVTEDERLRMEERLTDLQLVTQLGVSVEVLGHELEDINQQIERSLKALPKDIQSQTAWKQAYEAYRSLADQLRFLSRMKLSGYRMRRKISGSDIAEYLREFYGDRFTRAGISFETSEAFLQVSIKDLPSRIYPVFINLVNNAIYWCRFSEDRRILLDRVREKVVIADSGPGVHPDDVPRLFELFFTKRSKGRGVGLYLARANLAAASHTIRYASEGDPHTLTGANFIIEFNGLEINA